jgi:hypothetical protein
MNICLKHYIRDYVTKCNFLTYHVCFIHVFVFLWFFYQSGNPLVLFLFCNLFCMPIVIHLLSPNYPLNWHLLAMDHKGTDSFWRLSLAILLLWWNVYWYKYCKHYRHPLNSNRFSVITINNLFFHVVPCGPKIDNKLILLLLLLLLLYLYANCAMNIQPGTEKRLLIVITENLLEYMYKTNMIC